MIQSKLYSNIQKILAYSKSFLTVLGLILKCILYPGAHLFVTSGGKQQSAEILSQKVQELCRLIPPLEREINWSRGKTQEGKDYVKYIFKNGSVLDNLAAKESSRGQRRHGGSIEECVGVDDKILREVIIPVMAVPRRALDGTTCETEPVNKSQIYINILVILRYLYLILFKFMLMKNSKWFQRIVYVIRTIGKIIKK